MEYCVTDVIGCSVCQTRGGRCRCVQLAGEDRDCVEASGRHGPIHVGKITSEPGFRFASHGPLSTPVDTPTELKRAGFITGPKAAGNLALGENIINSSSPMLNDLEFQEDSSSRFSSQQLLTPPYSYQDQVSPSDYLKGINMSPGRADCLGSLFSLAWPDERLNQGFRPSQSPRSIEPPPDLEVVSDEGSDDPEDPENVQSEMVGFIALDRNVESNSLPFLLQAYATWITRFLFEPRRTIHNARREFFRKYTIGEESRRIMSLLANNAYEITRSADYNPANSSSFPMTEAIIRRRLTAADTLIQTSRELDIQYTRGAMEFTYEFISSLCKVGSLSSVMSMMQLAAPIFRRACPDSPERLVNLPTLLTTMLVSLQYYGTIDVLLGAMTGRPMFFRYCVEFTPEVPGSLFSLEDAPGLRRTYGVPDRLILTFAQMNALYEDFGTCVPKEVVDGLEEEIKRMQPIVGLSTETQLSVARAVVQECWFLAALLYLYMGLSGANSVDIRIAKVRARFMRVLATVRPGRNPDSFLVFPMIILGVATYDSNDRHIIRRRLLGVSECSLQGAMGNDFVRILEHIWTIRRPVVWSDLRQACWEVSGV